MENKKILKTAGQELEKEIYLQSHTKTLQGVQSRLLDVLIMDDDEKTREEFGNPIKEELQERIKKADTMKEPPKSKYLGNMNRIMADLDKRIKGEKIEKKREQTMNLDRKDIGFNKVVLGKFIEEAVKEAKTNDKIHMDIIYKKLTQHLDHIDEIVQSLKLELRDMTDGAQKKNIEELIDKLEKKQSEKKAEREEELKKRLIEKEWAKEIPIYKPEEEEEGTKKAPLHTPWEKEKEEIIRDLEDTDPMYIAALKNEIERMKNGETIKLSAKKWTVTLQKENEYGFKAMYNTIVILRPYIESDGEYKNSRVSKENLYRFIDALRKPVPKPTPTPTPIPTPTPTPAPTVTDKDLEMESVISDMGTDVHRERVSLEAEEELRDEYKGLARYNMPRRAYLFLSRGAKRKRLIKQKMDQMKGKAFSGIASLDEKTGDAAERHSVELQHKLDKVEKANKVTLQNPQVDDLCRRFLDGKVTDAQFQTDFNTIVDNDANIQSVLKGSKITHMGTNILEKLKLQRANKALIELVDTEINAYFADGNNTHIDTINQSIRSHIKYNQTAPGFTKDYEDFLKGVPGAKNKLEQYLKHQKAVMSMQITNLKMNLDILVKGKSAYQIDNKDRNKWRKYRLGNKLDKLPRRVQTAGFVALSVGTGILTGGLGAVASAAIVTWVSATGVGGMNALKKRTHYTKEQNTHEKNVVTDYRNEQAKIKERQNRALNGKRYQRKTYKAKRQLALYDQTTQEDVQISNTISEAITDMASKVGELNERETNYMTKNLIQGKVRLDYYREIGHNFLASNKKDEIEKDMKRLEKAIILGAEKLWIPLNSINTLNATDDSGANVTYDSIKKDLTNSYNKSLVQFKRERRNLAIKYGIGTAALSASMSLGMQYIMGVGVFSEKAVQATTPGSTTTTGAHEHFDLGKHELLDTGTRNNIYNTWSSTMSPSATPDGSTLTFSYGGWTDAVHVIPGRLTPEVYQSKIEAVISNIKGMHLNPGVEKTILHHIDTRPREMNRTTTNFTNDALHGMRCLETIEQTAKAMADSWRSGDILFNISYNPGLDIAGGTTTGNVLERVGQATFTVEIPPVPGTDPSTRGKYLQFPVFFNTFKDRVKPGETKPPKKPDEPEPPVKPEPETPKKPIIKDKEKYYDEEEKEKGPGPVGGKEGEDEEGVDIDPKTGKWKGKEKVTEDMRYGVSTRKEKTAAEIKDFAPDYPVEFDEKPITWIAEYVLKNPKIPLYMDPKYMNDSREAKRLRDTGNQTGAIKEMVRIITNERNYIKSELNTTYKGLLEDTYAAIEKTFAKYNAKELMKTLPAKENIHIMCKYDFDAYNRGVSKEWGEAVGVCYTTHGHIMINYDLIHMRGKSVEQTRDALIDTIIHELVHDSWINNYHHYYTLKDETKWTEEKGNIEKELFIARRVWLRMIKKIRGEKDAFMIYGTPMNEAITQMLADEIGKDLLKSGYTGEGYPQEKEVVRLLQDRYSIPFEMFAKAIINRTKEKEEGTEENSLKELNKKMNGEVKTIDGKRSYERPEFLRLVMGIMDGESANKHFGDEYIVTKAFINGERIAIDAGAKSFFHPGLLDKNGKLKAEIRKAYPNIVEIA